MNDPKISIIIPVYNAEKYIRQCLNSLINQTLKDIEIICVDDCSTDDSHNIIKELSKQDNRIRYLSMNKNSGSGLARNKGIENARGEYVSFVDSDDHIMNLEVYEEIYNFANKNKADIVTANLRAFNNKGEYFKNIKCPEVEKESAIIPQNYGVPWYHQKNLYKRSFINENRIKYPDYKRGQDPVFLANVLKNVKKVHCLPVEFYAYRTFESFDKLNSEDKELDYIRHFREVLDILDAETFPDTHQMYEEKMYDFFTSTIIFSTETVEKNIKTVFGENSDVYTIYKLKKSLIEKEKEIKKLKSNENLNYLETNEIHYFLDSVIESDGKDINLYVDDKELNFPVTNIIEDIYETSYFYDINTSIRKRLLSKFNALYIIFNRNNGSVKNAWINFKGYKSIKNNDLFDMGYYLRKNPDVRKSGKDPLLHYMYKGYKEGRTPNSYFDDVYYLENNPDVKALNLSPLVHYSLYGQKEKRKVMGNQEIKVVEVNPVYSALDMKTEIEISFNKPIKAGTKWIEIRKPDKELIPVEIRFLKNRIYLIPSEELSISEKYNLILHTDCIKDMFNNPLPLYSTVFSIDERFKDGKVKNIPKSYEGDNYGDDLENNKSFDNAKVTELINSNKLKVYPKVHLHISEKGNLKVNSSLEIGRTYEGRPYNISSLRIFDDATLTVQNDFKINTGANISIYPGAKLELGSGYANNNIRIDCNTTIKIGNHVFIASEVIIKDGDGHVIDNKPEKMSQPITIEDNVWIADRAIILKGVTIGSGSVVGAGAVVTKDVPKNSIVAGVPAKVIRENIEWG